MSKIESVQEPVQTVVEAVARPEPREAIAGVDAQLVNVRWRWLHAVWEADGAQLELSRVAIDLLLEQRFAIMQTRTAAA
ncbi:MAG: hypothetical protein QOH52_3213 [Pseudonocardiales bacterium]|jgi:hypothetical protein|nr:hypothetical protein [Pseudonocardiales bacterium]